MDDENDDGLDSNSGQAEIDENAQPLGQQFNYIPKQNAVHVDKMFIEEKEEKISVGLPSSNS